MVNATVTATDFENPTAERETVWAPNARPEWNVRSGVGRDGSAGGRPDPVPVKIEFCAVGNYRPVVNDLVEELAADGPVDLDLVQRRGGVFEVYVGGHLVFSKRATYRLPEADEILYHVRAAR